MRNVMLALLLAFSMRAAELPQVLVIGDSISIGYTPYLTQMLQGKATVTHNEGNAAHTRNGVEKLDGWLGATRWKVITFNFGLHDLKIMEDGKHQVSLADYEKNLDVIAKRLKKTKAKVVFVNTTPVPEGKLNPLRKPGDEKSFNAAAARVMKKNKIPVIDLESRAREKLSEIQTRANVHFSKPGYEYLAAGIAPRVEELLK